MTVDGGFAIALFMAAAVFSTSAMCGPILSDVLVGKCCVCVAYDTNLGETIWKLSSQKRREDVLYFSASILFSFSMRSDVSAVAVALATFSAV